MEGDYELPPGAKKLIPEKDKKDSNFVSVSFTTGQLMRLDRHIMKIKETLPEGYTISRHGFIKELVIRAIHGKDQ